MFTWELARHAVAEELVVYPAMERYLGGGWGREVAEKDRQEHQSVRSLYPDLSLYLGADGDR